MRGVRPAERDESLDFLRALRLAPIGFEEAVMAGDWRREYAARGMTLAQPDTLIAACAFHAGVPLATGNPKDFPMAGLRVEHWPVGE